MPDFLKHLKLALKPFARRSRRNPQAAIVVSTSLSAIDLQLGPQTHSLSPVVSKSSTLVHFSPDAVNRPSRVSEDFGNRRRAMTSANAHPHPQRRPRRESAPTYPNMVAFVRVPVIPGVSIAFVLDNLNGLDY
ncbi:hypothetical protein CVT26_014655 [Gymnopilus dilepis]|uniref:Uncharacterized protein n=1 Tax=Gymnopilus dilepis TaxID=231916 RepID=A0A409W3J3_9AGAR|nr:hypothetical protein CVT26_014655 [Gymnopilus dilepis]